MSTRPKILTVRELMERLRDLPPDLPVYAEGTEAEGEVTDVHVKTDHVLLETHAYHG